MANKNRISGTICLYKSNGIFALAFIRKVSDLQNRYKHYFRADEKNIARLFYHNGLIDEPQLFELVPEGTEDLLMGAYPRTLVFALLMGLPTEPRSIESIPMDLDQMLDAREQLINQRA